MKRKVLSKATLFLCIPLLILTGCGRRINITSNTFADTKNIPRGFPLDSTFYISSAKEDKKLLSKEIIRKIACLLEDRGYTVTDNESDADYHVTFDTKMTQETGTRSVLTYIPGDVQTTTGCVHGKETVSYQEQTETPGKFIYVPEKYTYYSRKLSVHAYIRDGEEEVWHGSAISEGESNDLRDIVDYLLVTAFRFFGRNTQKKVHTSISAKDKEVKNLREEVYSPLR